MTWASACDDQWRREGEEDPLTAGEPQAWRGHLMTGAGEAGSEGRQEDLQAVEALASRGALLGISGAAPSALQEEPSCDIPQKAEAL